MPRKRRLLLLKQKVRSTNTANLGRWISLKEFLAKDFHFLFEKGVMFLAEKGRGQGRPGEEVLGRLGKV